MECFVYVLGSFGKSGYRTYVGWTTDLDRRLAQHNAGTGARSTRGRVWVLLYAEQHATRREAMSREWHLKRDRRLRKRLARAHASLWLRPRATQDLASVQSRATIHHAGPW
ncbi:MAG TPA: GIY-YIG nuclease family protein [Terriglobales bacterium]